ncbi:MAG: type II CAAX endopeptidase family protein [Neobacillus sp.]
MKTMSQKYLCLLLFTSMMILAQTRLSGMIIWAFIACICLVTFAKKKKQFIYTSILFGFGFFVYLMTKEQVLFQNIGLARLLLVFQILPLIIMFLLLKQPISFYGNVPKWNELIWFPFIWSGFHSITVKKFLIIAVSINLMSLAPFYYDNLGILLERAVMGILIFSLINATLEEVIWRGLLLKLISNQLGEKWAVIITSIGFGLQHYSLGFSWLTCLFFTLGGLFYGGITVKSKSILPALMWHIVLNILMIISGFIPL